MVYQGKSRSIQAPSWMEEDICWPLYTNQLLLRCLSRERNDHTDLGTKTVENKCKKKLASLVCFIPELVLQEDSSCLGILVVGRQYNGVSIPPSSPHTQKHNADEETKSLTTATALFTNHYPTAQR